MRTMATALGISLDGKRSIDWKSARVLVEIKGKYKKRTKQIRTIENKTNEAEQDERKKEIKRKKKDRADGRIS